jgi:hypothetical protein
MTELTRTKQGPFELEDCVPAEDVTVEKLLKQQKKMNVKIQSYFK